MATSPSAARRRTGKPPATSLSADQSSSQTRKGCARAPLSPRASRLSRLAAWKRPAGRIGQGEVREVELARPPRGCAGDGRDAIRCGQRGPEERELKPDVATRGGLEVARVVPPLGAELRVRPAIVGKRKRTGRERTREAGEIARAERIADGDRRLRNAAPRCSAIGERPHHERHHREPPRRSRRRREPGVAAYSSRTASAGSAVAIFHAG